MSHSDRMLRIEQARQKLYGAMVDGIDFGNEDNSDRMEVIRSRLNQAIETACTLEMEDEYHEKIQR